MGDEIGLTSWGSPQAMVYSIENRDRKFWDERACKYGMLAVGYVTDRVLYEFEEELRWRAFRCV